MTFLASYIGLGIGMVLMHFQPVEMEDVCSSFDFFECGDGLKQIS